MEKYSDGYDETTEEKKPSLLVKLLNLLLQIVVGIFGIGLFIVILPFALPYLFICIVLGHTPTIRLKRKNTQRNKPLLKTYYGQHN